LKYIDEYRDGKLVRNLLSKIEDQVSRPWKIMEICGGQTHSFMKYGLLDLLPEEIKMIHGPGCPVCVTPVELIDKAVALCLTEQVILASFGDMLRVPGSHHDLLGAKAAGGEVRAVFSPMDALHLAIQHPDKEVVFFAVGFETTVPAVALAVKQARKKNLANFSILVAHVRVPPAMEALLSAPDTSIDGFLAAGHVCTVMGYEEYIPISERYRIPVVVTGFEPVDLLLGILKTTQMLEAGISGVENAYSRSVRKEGNISARKLLEEVFEPCDRRWRGIGVIPLSGYALKGQYTPYDAGQKFNLGTIQSRESKVCIAGEILTGSKVPTQCPAFGKACTPEKPLGAPMVSSEGTCAAYYRFRLTA
jgi:hydrogenase expression/formation protein HypD